MKLFTRLCTLFIIAGLFSCEKDYEFPNSKADSSIKPSELTIKNTQYTNIDGKVNLSITHNDGIDGINKVTLVANNKEYKTIDVTGDDFEILASDLKVYKEVGDVKKEVVAEVGDKVSAKVYFVNGADGKERVKAFDIEKISSVKSLELPTLNSWDINIDDTTKFAISFELQPKVIASDEFKVGIEYKIDSKTGSDVSETILKSDLKAKDKYEFELIDHKFNGTVINTGDKISVRLIIKKGANIVETTSWEEIEVADKFISSESVEFELGVNKSTDTIIDAFNLLTSEEYSFNIKDQVAKADTIGVWLEQEFTKIKLGEKVEVAYVTGADKTKIIADGSLRQLKGLTYKTYVDAIDGLYEDDVIAIRIINAKGEYSKYGTIKVVNYSAKKTNGAVKLEYKIGDLK
jgi:hypothetical protein